MDPLFLQEERGRPMDPLFLQALSLQARRTLVDEEEALGKVCVRVCVSCLLLQCYEISLFDILQTRDDELAQTWDPSLQR